jgi:hypothetical protein
MSPRPATALEIAVMIVACALANPCKRAAFLKAKNVAGVANDFFQAGGISIAAAPDVIEDRISRLYVGRMHLFLPPDCSNGHNLSLLQDLEFEPFGLLACEKPKDNFLKGARK